MFFHGFKAVPEWAPPRENHILYSKTVLKNVIYASASVQYTATNEAGTEYLRLAFLPDTVSVNGTGLPLLVDLNAEGYKVRSLGGGDYAVAVRRERGENVVLASSSTPAGLSTVTTQSRLSERRQFIHRDHYFDQTRAQFRPNGNPLQ